MGGEAMTGLTGERTLLRIHIGERDKHQGQPLYEAIVLLLRQRAMIGGGLITLERAQVVIHRGDQAKEGHS
jgi:hypothetical protein